MAETSLRSRAEGQDIFDHEFDQPRLRNGFSTQGGAAPELLPSGSSQSEVKESIADTVAKFLRARDFKTLAAMDVVFDQATVIGSGSGVCCGGYPTCELPAYMIQGSSGSDCYNHG